MSRFLVAPAAARAALVVLAVLACGQRTPPRFRGVPWAAYGPPGPPGPLPSFGHVFVVVEENANYAAVIGDTSMPYLNSLARQYALATQFYANTHPSIGNYFMMIVGDTITNDDGFSGLVTRDNLVRALTTAGKTWKSYAEDLPAVGYAGAGRGRYARKHNIFVLLSDVAHDSAQARNLVPFTQLATDLAGNTLPDYAFIIPNLCNDAHDCPLRTADAWLATHIDPLVRSEVFQRENSLLIIVFDESGVDDTVGGGRIACVIVSPQAKRGYESTTFYQQQSLLRLSLRALGVTTYPGAAASAPDMDEFFETPGGGGGPRAHRASAGGSSRSNQN